MRMNGVMERHLTELKIDLAKNDVVLNENLSNLINLGFVEFEGCVLLNGLKKPPNHAQIADFQDKTGFECFINKIHIEDYFADKKTPKKERAKQAVEFGRKLKEKLSLAFDCNRFEIFFSTDGEHYIVNFHKIRNGEMWLSDNLDGYKDEGILVFNV